MAPRDAIWRLLLFFSAFKVYTDKMSVKTCLFHLQLGQLDVVIKEHKLEMERKVEHLQEVQEKTERKLREREKQVQSSLHVFKNPHDAVI